MSNIEKKNILSKNERYIDLTTEELRKEFDEILELWIEFVSRNDSELELNKDYFIQERSMFEIIKRTDKRKVYYHVFHKIQYPCINEIKEVGIIAYWINTLKPFSVVKKDSPIYNSPNERLALSLILGTISSLCKEIFGENYITPCLTKDAEINYIYYFKYCDVSRESMIQFVEMLASIYKVGTKVKDDTK